MVSSVVLMYENMSLSFCKIPKLPSEGNIRYYVENEELCFLCKVYELEVSLGGKVFHFDKLYDICDIVVDRAFEEFIFFSGVLRMGKFCGLESGSGRVLGHTLAARYCE